MHLQLPIFFFNLLENGYSICRFFYLEALVNANSPAGYVISSIAGLIFGFVMNKGRVIDPSIIRDQMVMSRFVGIRAASHQ